MAASGGAGWVGTDHPSWLRRLTLAGIRLNFSETAIGNWEATCGSVFRRLRGVEAPVRWTDSLTFTRRPELSLR